MFPVSLCLFFISLFAVFKAPAKPLWFLAIGATEWGHFMAIDLYRGGAFQLAIRPSAGAPRLGSPRPPLFLFLTPLLRAAFVAQELPNQLASRFGMVTPREETEAPARGVPLSIANLFLGVHSPAIQKTTHVYATVNGQELSLDLYRPSRIDESLPGVIIIHGGSWQSGDRSEFPDLDRYLAARGYIVASLDYRLAPAAIFPAQRDDVISAIAYLKDHARAIGLDRDHLVLLGRSAGGQIALSAAYSDKDPSDQRRDRHLRAE